jgi:hypothetical protein
MLSVQASKIVPGALGLYVQKAVAEGEVVAVEHARFLSAPTSGVHPDHHNGRYAWSMVENILRNFSSAEGLGALLAALRKDAFATGLGSFTWEEPGDSRALAWLTATYPRHDRDAIRAIYDIMGTNAIAASGVTRDYHVPGLARPVRVEDTHLHGFFPLFSRINHSCVPNTKPQPPVDAQGPLRLVALRALEAGEELTFHYLTQGDPDPTTDRPALLRRYGFRCSCPRCRQLCALLECPKKTERQCPCHRARYCGPEHQKLDWARHKGAEHVL